MDLPEGYSEKGGRGLKGKPRLSKGKNYPPARVTYFHLPECLHPYIPWVRRGLKGKPCLNPNQLRSPLSYISSPQTGNEPERKGFQKEIEI